MLLLPLSDLGVRAIFRNLGTYHKTSLLFPNSEAILFIPFYYFSLLSVQHITHHIYNVNKTMYRKIVKMEIKNRLHYFIKIESVWGVKVHILSRLKIKNFVLEKNFFSRYPIWKSLCLPVKNPNFPKIFFASSRAPQKLPKKSVWRNPSINFDLVYLILSTYNGHQIPVMTLILD